jgi:hypothetical protein
MGAVRCRDCTLHTEAGERSAAATDVNEIAKAGSIPVPVFSEGTMQNGVVGEEEGEGKGEVCSGPIRDEL